jgi:Cu/Ag efflux protein CusF
VEGYVIEGHVPAAEVRRLLVTKPAAIGLVVLGMPLGSPGMDVDDRLDPYEVLIVDRRGQASVFAKYPPNDHASHHPEASSASSVDIAKAEGEVRKVDKEAGKLTLRHGPISNLEMPEMTMVFRLVDPKLLDGLLPKQKVRFTAERLEGQLTVTSIEVVQ